MNHLGSAIAKDYLYSGIKYAKVKGTIKLTRELVRTESRHLPAETARSVGLVYLIDCDNESGFFHCT
jgi:hypothetical protein